MVNKIIKMVKKIQYDGKQDNKDEKGNYNMMVNKRIKMKK